MSCDQCGVVESLKEIEDLDSSSDDSDSDYRDDHWEDRIIVLTTEDAWEKPKGHEMLINSVSIAVPHGSKGMHGVLTVMTDDFNVTIAKLTKEKPCQQLKVMFSGQQNAVLLNDGNRPITISLIVRK